MHLRDVPDQVTIRKSHAFEGQTLAVISSIKRRGVLLVPVILPNGSRSLVPAAWTDWRVADANASLSDEDTDHTSSLGKLGDLLSRLGATRYEAARITATSVLARLIACTLNERAKITAGYLSRQAIVWTPRPYRPAPRNRPPRLPSARAAYRKGRRARRPLPPCSRSHGASAASQTSLVKFVHSADQSRKAERKPCTVASSILMRRSHHFERHHRQRLAGLLTRKHEIAIARLMHRLHDLERALGQRNAMLAAGLHAGGRDGPDGAIKIKFIPARVERLAGARGRENGKFECQRGFEIMTPRL